MAVTVSAATADAMGAGIWGEPTTGAAITMHMDTVVATTMEATTTATCHLTIIIRDSTAGPTTRGPRRWHTDGAGEERRGLDTTATTSIPTRCMPAQHCG